MPESRCAARCKLVHGMDRRSFIKTSTFMVGAAMAGGCAVFEPRPALPPMRLNGPASKVRPKVYAAFVRRKEDYGMWWPGAVYDGEAARKMYTEKILATAAGYTTGEVLRVVADDPAALIEYLHNKKLR